MAERRHLAENLLLGKIYACKYSTVGVAFETSVFRNYE